MASVAHSFMKLFRGPSEPGQDHGQSVRPPRPAQRLTRRSSALAELTRLLQSQEPLCILDIGSTSAPNIRYVTERGHKIYSEDILDASTDPALVVRDGQGNTTLDHKRFLAENLVFRNAQFDLVLCWNLADYLDEDLVKPLVARFWSMIRPGGVLLAFFHTQEAGPDAPCYRYHITGNDTLEMQHVEARGDLRKGPGPQSARGPFRLQRVFNNRHIENLFRDFTSIKFFLTRDNIREILVVR
ncbi:MAG: methyltransferase domain-containing protein [Terriglobales bacterium]